jgi:hypothetical protein
VGDQVGPTLVREGRCSEVISGALRGEQGFGDDPLFIIPEPGANVLSDAGWSGAWPKRSPNPVRREPHSGVLDKVLSKLSNASESLEHVLDHITFMRVQSNRRIVSDDVCKDRVRHFSRYRLRNEDFQFSDLLGAAYEFPINMFAESAGTKGGDFYTPRDVIRLVVRIIKPRPGLSIYDPTRGSGGMLIIGREFVEQSGGDATNLHLCGQVNDASAWSICKLNMLLHGVQGADIRLEDTLLHQRQREAGELAPFDRDIPQHHPLNRVRPEFLRPWGNPHQCSRGQRLNCQGWSISG